MCESCRLLVDSLMKRKPRSCTGFACKLSMLESITLPQSYGKSSLEKWLGAGSKFASSRTILMQEQTRRKGVWAKKTHIKKKYFNFFFTRYHSIQSDGFLRRRNMDEAMRSTSLIFFFHEDNIKQKSHTPFPFFLFWRRG